MERSRPKLPERTLIGPAKQNICAIVVTYFPDEHFGERLEKIYSQVGKIIIIDNTVEESRGALSQSTVHDDIEIVINNENVGIGAALNQGVSRAIKLGFEWVITFDQDSWVHPDLVKILISIYDQQSRPELVGVIGCNFEDENTHTTAMKHLVGGPKFVETQTVITSGSLLSIPTLKKVGPFRSDFFIDFIDYEYCLRLLQSGYTVIVSTAPLMKHALGCATLLSVESRVGRLSLVLTNRSPLRRYYMTRNGLLVAKTYFLVAPKWALRSLASLLGFAVLKIPWEKDSRARKFWATIVGAFDALRSKTGKAQASWLEE
jgi:rhamnosyltransferase